MHVLHFRYADVRLLYPAIKLAAGLSPQPSTRVPFKLILSPFTINGTPDFYIKPTHIAIESFCYI